MSEKEYFSRIKHLSTEQRRWLALQLGNVKRDFRGSSESQEGAGTAQGLVAYFSGTDACDEAALRSHLKAQLPEYMVPTRFVRLEAIPKLPNGKIDRNALPDLPAIEAPPEPTFLAPRTTVEKLLAEIWEEVLDISPISIRDNFFEIGGDSILSIQIVSKARSAGLDLSPNQLFEQQTIEALALSVNANNTRAGKSEEDSRIDGPSSPVSAPDYEQWSLHLSDLAQTDEVRSEFAFWQEQLRLAIELPSCFETASAQTGVTEETETIKWALDREITRSLSTTALEAYHTRVEDLLVTALVSTLESWKGVNSCCIGIERFERFDFGQDAQPVEVTTFFPLVLRIQAEADAGSNIKRIKEQLRSVPGLGTGYGLLRYHAPDEGVRATLKYHPEIKFSYLSQNLAKRSDIQRKEASPQLPPFISGDTPPPALLEIKAFMLENQLRLHWNFTGNDARFRKTVEKLSKIYTDTLGELVEHCIQIKKPGYTPSDFPDSGLNQSDLDNLFDQLE